MKSAPPFLAASIPWLLLSCGLSCGLGCGSQPWVDESRIIDLTYPFNEKTVYWPTAKTFELKRVAHGLNESGKWYAANELSAAEHGGTHLDAPIHFAMGMSSVADIPLSRLMGPARVIDIRKECARDRNYLLSVDDIQGHEEHFGRIEPGSAVLILTGFGAFYPDLKRYLGSDVRGVAENLQFPGIGEAAARLLVERKIDLVGIDTASMDHGPTKDFPSHRVFGEANIPGLENLANLEKLPARGAFLQALPMKIDGGTGGPCRVIAWVP
jgi:kynurenine formamidase